MATHASIRFSNQLTTLCTHKRASAADEAARRRLFGLCLVLSCAQLLACSGGAGNADDSTSGSNAATSLPPAAAGNSATAPPASSGSMMTVPPRRSVAAGDSAPAMSQPSGGVAGRTSSTANGATSTAGVNAPTMAGVASGAGAGGSSGAASTSSPVAGASEGAAGAAGMMASTAAGACQKGTVKASEVIVMGESFYAINRNILDQIEKNAKAGGALGMSESYRNYSVSGQLLTGTIPGQFDKALADGQVKVVIMDGGGNDCMSSPCDMCPPTFEKLLKKMADNKVENVIYTRYPEPGNPPGSLTTLKKNLDILMPKMEEVCAKVSAPKCHWVDLRPVWKDGDTSDGLHPTVSGGQHVGDAIWAKMLEKCIAQ